MRQGMWLGGAVALTVVSGLHAQSDISSYVIRYYNAGATAPLQTQTFLPGQYQCNQDIIDSTITANPNAVEWDDPDASGRKCHYVEVPGGVLFSLPVGNYEASLVAINSFGASPESTRAPFALGAVAATPTGVRVVR